MTEYMTCAVSLWLVANTGCTSAEHTNDGGESEKWQRTEELRNTNKKRTCDNDLKHARRGSGQAIGVNSSAIDLCHADAERHARNNRELVVEV